MNVAEMNIPRFRECLNYDEIGFFARSNSDGANERKSRGNIHSNDNAI